MRAHSTGLVFTVFMIGSHSHAFGQGVPCEYFGSTDVETNISNSQEITLSNASIVAAYAEAAPYGHGVCIEFGPSCYPRHPFLFVTDSDNDVADLLTDSVSAVAIIDNPDKKDPDQTIGLGHISASASASASLLANVTSSANDLYIEICTNRNCSMSEQGNGSALNIANGIPILGLSYDVEAVNPSLPASLSVELNHAYFMSVVIISGDSVIRNQVAVRRGTYYRYAISSSIDSDMVYGLYAYDASDNQVKLGLFEDMGFEDTEYFDEFYGDSLLDGEAVSNLNVDIDDEDAVVITIQQMDFFGDSADLDQDGYINSVDRSLAQAAADDESVVGEELYMPQLDYDLNLVIDSSDLWAFKQILFETEPVCEYRADSNNDGAVTTADYSAWISLYNAVSPFADTNNDGAVTAADYSAWSVHYNACTAP